MVYNHVAEDIRLLEAQFIFNQVTCLEQVGNHQGILETYPFAVTGKGIRFL